MADWKAQMRQLVAERYDHLVAYAQMVAGSRADAEDLVSDALVATFGRPRDFTNTVVAESYVRKAIMTKFIDSTRKRGRDQRITAAMGQQLESSVPDMSGHVAGATDLMRAMVQLPPRERACVALRYLEHQSVRETAVTLGLAEGSVKRYVADGIGRLNSLLGTRDDAADLAPVSTPAGGQQS